MSTPEILLLAGAVVTLGWVAARAAVTSAVERAVAREFRRWEVRFTKYHERRIEVIEAVQDHLVDLRDALTYVFEHLDGNPDPVDPEAFGKQLTKALDHIHEADRVLAARGFYLPRDTVERLRALLKQTALANALAQVIDHLREERLGPTDPAELVRHVRKLEEVRKELPALVATLDKEFRRFVEE